MQALQVFVFDGAKVGHSGGTEEPRVCSRVTRGAADSPKLNAGTQRRTSDQRRDRGASRQTYSVSMRAKPPVPTPTGNNTNTRSSPVASLATGAAHFNVLENQPTHRHEVAERLAVP
jgi:hypothetical protein